VDLLNFECLIFNLYVVAQIGKSHRVRTMQLSIRWDRCSDFCCCWRNSSPIANKYSTR